MGDRVDEGVKVEGWEVRVLGLDIYHRRGVVPRQVHMVWQRVIEVREGYAILSTYWLANDNLVDVVEFIPVLISDQLLIFHERFKLWPSWNCKIQRFGCEERLEIKQIEVIVINQIS